MAAEFAIRAHDLGKRYVIGHKPGHRNGYSLREVMALNMRGMANSVRDKLYRKQSVVDRTAEEFWAIRGINFEIRRGEVVGIIGRNGAGKSTLLKILSRITEPTEGRVEIRGRVASLLEVGTGFHPDLTGRENLFLNGAVLGMSRAEIRRKFDEIVAFADVERFIDTPVKRYSSGMYVRLAFAVAAHLEPEILIVDEVLAVGDAEFQRKCLGKMHDVAGLGRTVLFVSHNMAAVEQLCSRVICLDAGQIRMQGQVRDVVAHYFSHVAREVLQYVPQSDAARDAELTEIALCAGNGKRLKVVTAADTPVLEFDILIRKLRPDLKLAFVLFDSRENAIFASTPLDAGVPYPTQPGCYRFRVSFPDALLMPQRYSISVSVYSARTGSIHNCQHALAFDVLPAQSLFSSEPNRMGIIQMRCNWEEVGIHAQNLSALTRQAAAQQPAHRSRHCPESAGDA
jgi:lipopolysaccharide transport system ATP-binding protein